MSCLTIRSSGHLPALQPLSSLRFSRRRAPLNVSVRPQVNKLWNRNHGKAQRTCHAHSRLVPADRRVGRIRRLRDGCIRATSGFAGGYRCLAGQSRVLRRGQMARHACGPVVYLWAEYGASIATSCVLGRLGIFGARPLSGSQRSALPAMKSAQTPDCGLTIRSGAPLPGLWFIRGARRST